MAFGDLKYWEKFNRIFKCCKNCVRIRDFIGFKIVVGSESCG